MIPRHDRPLRDVHTRCPACGYTCDAVAQAGGPGPTRPADGDVSICMRCAHVALFAAAAPGGLVNPDPDALAELMSEDAVIAAVTGIRLMNRSGAGVPWSRE